MWTAEDCGQRGGGQGEDGCGQRGIGQGEAMEGYIKVQRPGELHSEETLARYAPGEPSRPRADGCSSCSPSFLFSSLFFRAMLEVLRKLECDVVADIVTC